MKYDIGVVSNSSFLTSVYDYNVDLANLPILYEAIYADLLAYDYRIARMLPKSACFHYCSIVSNVALLDSIYDRGRQVDDLPTPIVNITNRI